MARRRKFRPLSLRLVFSCLGFICGVVIAALTVSVTIVTGKDALRSLGRTECTSILRGCAQKTLNVFDGAQSIAKSLRQTVTGTRLSVGWPSNSDDLLQEWITTSHILFNQVNSGREQSVAAIITLFADNTNIITSYGYTGDRVIFTSVAHPTPIGTADALTNTTALAQQVITLDVIVRYAINRTYVPESTALYMKYLPSNSTMPENYPKVRDKGGLWSQASAVSIRSPFLVGVISAAEPGTSVVGVVLVVVPLYRDVRDLQVFAYSTITVQTVWLSKILPEAIAVTNAPTATAFIVDGSGYIVAGSLDDAIPSSRSALGGSRVSANESCIEPTTQQLLVGTTWKQSLCRAHMSYYSYRPLAALDADWVLDAPNAIDASGPLPPFTVYDVDGTTTYAVASRVDLGYPGFVLYTVVIISEDAVLGDLKTGYLTVIGITLGLLVAVGVVSFVLTTLLLAPLRHLGTRMSRAAHFRDTEDAEELSTLHDVRALQEAYNDMNVELHRIRSFVPQSVLARYEAESESISDNTHQSSRRSSYIDDDASLESFDLNAEPAREPGEVTANARAAHQRKILKLAVQRQLVTVFVARFRSLQRCTQNFNSGHDVVSALAELAAAATRVVSEAGGIVALYSGDSVMATFNAVKKCEGHATRGSLAACRLVKNLSGSKPEPEGNDAALLSLTSAAASWDFRAGVSTGMCMVGNVGSETAKNHSTMGSAVAEAFGLEAIASRYGEDCRVLGSRRVVCEGGALMHVYVDVVKSGQGRDGIAKALPVAALFDRDANGNVEALLRESLPASASAAAAAGGDDMLPWLYDAQREAEGRKNSEEGSVDETALQLRNRVVEDLGSGQIGRALRCLALRLPSRSVVATAAAEAVDASHFADSWTLPVPGASPESPAAASSSSSPLPLPLPSEAEALCKVIALPAPAFVLRLKDYVPALVRMAFTRARSTEAVCSDIRLES